MMPLLGEPPVDSTVVAAAKLAHELGHVERTGRMSMEVMQIQARLTPQYVTIFLNNGLNPRDRRLLDLERQMGGTPTRLWEEREYQSEVEAMRYLSEKLGTRPERCRIFRRIRLNLLEYAPRYEPLFGDQPEFSSIDCR